MTMSREGTAQRIELIERVRAVRLERFGSDIDLLATALGIPARTWTNYEAGVVMPAEVMLGFLALTGASPEWLLTGRGYSSSDSPLDF
jgi:hypothetical protein